MARCVLAVLLLTALLQVPAPAAWAMGALSADVTPEPLLVIAYTDHTRGTYTPCPT